MRVLLDTSAFLRWTADDKLPPAVERRLLRTDTECYVSIVSAWEIAIKPALGRDVSGVEQTIANIGAFVLPLRFAHINQIPQLPAFRDHRDPFDRILIAQAIAENLTMISSDQRFGQYQQLQLLWD